MPNHGFRGEFRGENVTADKKCDCSQPVRDFKCPWVLCSGIQEDDMKWK